MIRLPANSLPGIRTLCLCLLAAWLASCATVPETGRRQLLLVSSSEEVQLGIKEFDQMKQNTPICRDAATNELVRRAGQRIAAVAPLPNAQWEFVVFNDPKIVNAFCLPGGKVGVYTGILPLTQNEAGLATVLGHEVSHAVAHHGGERLSEGLLVQFGGLVLGEVMARNSDAARSLAQQAYGLTGAVGVMLPHSRQQELEADHLGLIYMARAGYDPREAVEFWKRMEAFSASRGKQPVQFLSTHPVDAVRIQQLEAELPAATEEYEKARR